jgi:predicted nucleic acid-binding protein
VAELERFFFDTSAFVAVINNEVECAAIESLLLSLKRTQKTTSVLVAYELFKGIPLRESKRKTQIQITNLLLKDFTLKPVYERAAMAGAALFRHSAGEIDPILAAQSIEGGFTFVTKNIKHFDRVPGIKIHPL